MAIRLNLFCNGQIAAKDLYLKNMDKVKWGPGGVKRDALGLPILEEGGKADSSEEKEDANLQE